MQIQTKRIGLVQNRHHIIEMHLVLVMIWLKNRSLGVKQQSLNTIIHIQPGSGWLNELGSCIT